MSGGEPQLCTLSRALGSVEECPRAWCAFWDQGGAIIEPHCSIERLGLDLSNLDLAAYILELRQALDTARSEEEAETARRQLVQLVPPDLAGA
jgi:hypothetical protein